MTDSNSLQLGRDAALGARSDAPVKSRPSHHIQKRFPWFGPLFANPWTTWEDPSPRALAKALWQMLRRNDIRLDGTLIGNISPQTSDYAYVRSAHSVHGRLTERLAVFYQSCLSAQSRGLAAIHIADREIRDPLRLDRSCELFGTDS